MRLVNRSFPYQRIVRETMCWLSVARFQNKPTKPQSKRIWWFQSSSFAVLYSSANAWEVKMGSHVKKNVAERLSAKASQVTTHCTGFLVEFLKEHRDDVDWQNRSYLSSTIQKSFCSIQLARLKPTRASLAGEAKKARPIEQGSSSSLLPASGCASFFDSACWFMQSRPPLLRFLPYLSFEIEKKEPRHRADICCRLRTQFVSARTSVSFCLLFSIFQTSARGNPNRKPFHCSMILC